jgi:sodium transport system permease protein
MNWQHLRLTFLKDGLEMLRDRRTLFVNLVLPVLLYPVLTLITLQVLQLTRPGPEDLPRLVPVDLSLEIENGLPLWHGEDGAATPDGDDEAGPARFRIIRPLPLIDRARHLRGRLQDADPETQATARAELLALMRDHDCVLLLLGPGPDQPEGHPLTIEVLADNAHREAVPSQLHLRTAFDRLEAQLLVQRLAERGLPASFARPLLLVPIQLAPQAEAARTHIASFIPVILLLIAISGAFYPALDLIAGERERGTLETLLSWPGDRQAIFTGKLLVVMSAALVSVILNLASLGLTAGIIGTQLPAEANVFGQGISIGPANLLVGLALLIPLTLTLATIALALAGMAASFKEAQNYLSPFMLLVMTPGLLCLLPQVRPGILLDLTPVIGPLVALKASLQSEAIPWGHVLLAFLAAAGLCVLVVQWSVRLLGQETFLYPNLKRRGWGRFSAFPEDNPQVGGTEAVLLWCVALAGFLSVSGLTQSAPAVVKVMAPLIFGALVPVLVHAWLGGYRLSQSLRLQPVAWRTWALLPPLWLLCSLMAVCISGLQLAVVPPDDNLEAQRSLVEIFSALAKAGGLPLLLLAVAMTPGICEEALFRGPMLSGLQRSLGPRSAVVVCAALFGATHMDPARFFPQFAIGLVAGGLVLRSRSVLPAMVLHLAFNGGFIIQAYLTGPRLDGEVEPSDLFQGFLQEMMQISPPIAELLRACGPILSFLLGLLVLVVLGLGCRLVMRRMQPHHRAQELGADQPPGESAA